MAVVVQPRFVVVVLALESDRVGQAFLPRPVRALFRDFAPRFVLPRPGHVAVVVGEFLRGAEVVAVVPGQRVERRGFGFVDPQRVLVDVVGAFVGRLGQQADWLLAYGLSHGYEAAGFEDVVHGAPGAAAVGLGRGSFPGEGVAVPAVEGETAAQFALFTRLFVVVPLRAGFGAFSVVGVGAFTQAPAEGVVDVVDAQTHVVELHQAVEQVPVQLALLAVVPAADLVAAFVVFVVGVESIL